MGYYGTGGLGWAARSRGPDRRVVDSSLSKHRIGKSVAMNRDAEVVRVMEREMQRIADEALRGFFSGVPQPEKYWQPRADVHETAASVIVKVEVPGVRPDALTVALSSDDRVLTVSGTRYEDHEEREDRIRCYQLEIYFGPFERQIPLPAGVRVDRDAVTAKYRDGMLLVHIPKGQQRPRTATEVEVE